MIVGRFISGKNCRNVSSFALYVYYCPPRNDIEVENVQLSNQTHGLIFETWFAANWYFQMVGTGSTSGVPPPLPPTPRGTPTSSTPGLFPNNVRRRLSSPGPSRFLSPLTVPKKRQGREDLARGEQQGAGQRATSRKHIVFWCPRLRKTDGALSIEGQLMDENVAISEQSVYSTRVVIAKGSLIRVHGRSRTEYILEGKLVAKETSFPAIFHSISNTPDVLLNK